MRRGFKTESEQKAEELRRQLRLVASAPLPARSLARHLGVAVITPNDVPGMTDEMLHQLLTVDPKSWSATTISTRRRSIIIYNNAHLHERQESDVMHELAHLLCGHEPSEVALLANIPFPLRKFDQNDEDEAGWLGGCLQLPRAAIWWGVRRGMSDMDLVEHFGASKEMVRYRRRVTGVDAQFARMQNSPFARSGRR